VNVLDLSLTDGVELDLRDSSALAHRLLIVSLDSPEADLSQAAIEALSSDLLPDWYDDWVMPEAAQWHELRVHALVALADKLTSVRRYADSAQAANLAIKAEPLRESGYAALIRIHQAQGNQTAVNTVFEQYRSLARTELSAEPTSELQTLVANLAPREASSVIRQVRTAVAGEETRAFEVVALGISMEPSIRHGDKLLVSLGIQLEAGRVVVATHQDVWIVKRLMLRDGALVLRSDNADEEVAIADVDIKGVVLEIHRTI
jgi:hypothetical protein